MARKQVAELRRRVLAKFPKGCKVKHSRTGGVNNMRTEASVVSEAGNVLQRQSAESLEQALRAMLTE